MISYLKTIRLRILIIILVELAAIACSFYFGKYVLDLVWLVAYVLAALLTLDVVFMIVITHSIDRHTRKNYLSVNQLLGFEAKHAFDFGQLGIIIYDDHSEIIWTNEFLEARGWNIVGLELNEWNEELMNKFQNTESDSATVTIDERIYQCKHLKELKSIIFQDVTELSILSKTYTEEAPVYMSVVIDNYAEVAMLMEEDEIIKMETEVRAAISNWAEKYGLLLKRYRNESYICLCSEKNYQEVFKSGFNVLDDVRNITDASENRFTLSIGVARGDRDFNNLSEMSNSALDVALSRGGDQVVVNTAGHNMEFYGGKTEAKTQRHKVKIKVTAKTFDTFLNAADKIYVMGHVEADFDAIGACLAVYTMATSLGKECKIVYDESLVNIKTKQAFKQLFDKKTIEKMTVSPKEAIDGLEEDSVLVLVDANRKNMAMSSELINKASKIIVVDHHIAAEKMDGQIFSCQEASASSTCELLAEMIKYNEKKIVISSEIATMMLTGILLDTNTYKTKTGTRTYDASIILKEFGADTTQALEFLKEEYEEYLLKNKIMSTSSMPYYGVIVAKASEEDIVDRATIAKIAEEALFIKGIKTIFIVGRVGKNEIGISARGDGSTNVSLIMEKLGGGGHFSAAAAQKEGTTIDEYCQELMDILEVYVGDNRLQ